MDSSSRKKRAFGDPAPHCVEYRGYFYCTLDATPPFESEPGTQVEYVLLPTGWELAPNTSDIVDNVVRCHMWGTSILFVDGAAYGTLLCPGFTGIDFSGGNERIEKQQGSEGVCLKPILASPLFRRVLIRRAARESLGISLWKKRRFTDCLVVCSDLEVPCHRAVLANFSPVLERMLQTDMREGSERRVVIADCSPTPVGAMIEFMYTEEIAHVEAKHISSLLCLADKYDIESLFQASATRLLECLNEDLDLVEVVRVLKRLAHRHQCRKLLEDFSEKVRADKTLFGALMQAI